MHPHIVIFGFAQFQNFSSLKCASVWVDEIRRADHHAVTLREIAGKWQVRYLVARPGTDIALPAVTQVASAYKRQR